MCKENKITPCPALPTIDMGYHFEPRNLLFHVTLAIIVITDYMSSLTRKV
jgi:hypothetical protein